MFFSFFKSFQFQKYLLYVFLFFTCICIILFFKENSSENFDYEEYKRNLEIKSDEKKLHFVKLIEDLEKYLLEKRIKISNIKLKDQNIDIQIISNLDESITLLGYLESYSGYLKIKNYNVVYDENTNKLITNISASKSNLYFMYYDSKSNYVDDTVFFKNINKLKEKEPINENLVLKAIVDDRVLINNTWYTRSDYVGSSQIVLVKDDYIKLKDKKDYYTIKVHNNEYSK